MSVEYSFGFVMLSGGSELTVDGFLPRLLLGAGIAWIGWAAATSGLKSVRDCWGILTSESLPIDEAIATSGLVQIQGHVRPLQPDDTLTSPIFNRECVAYEYTISKVVQDSSDSSIDSDTAYRSFIITDGTGEILVDPDEDSLSLNMTTQRTTSSEELIERTDDDTLEFDPSAYTSDGGIIPKPIELREGTISLGEEITVVGEATPESEGELRDGNAVMTSGTDHLMIMNDDPGNTAMRNAARGAFLLVIGAMFGIFAIFILRAAILDIV
jgi:E3 Ubiquitin ligase.